MGGGGGGGGGGEPPERGAGGGGGGAPVRGAAGSRGLGWRNGGCQDAPRSVLASGTDQSFDRWGRMVSIILSCTWRSGSCFRSDSRNCVMCTRDRCIN